MHPFINLVGTRCKTGEHDLLFRWYNDHISILMGYAALQGAMLYRRMASDTTRNTVYDTSREISNAIAPEYICLYEFPSRLDFMGFEVSAAREAARQVLLSGWGKRGVEITLRTQFERLGRRTLPARGVGLSMGATAAEPWLFQSLNLGAGPKPEVDRWLNDRVHAVATTNATTTATDPPFLQVTWHRAALATDAGGGALVMAQTRHVEGTVPVWPDPWWKAKNTKSNGQNTQHGAWGTAPQTVTLAWQAAYLRLGDWSR